jgi:hypothetical protein
LGIEEGVTPQGGIIKIKMRLENGIVELRRMEG